jgi:hypothetical protein
MAPFGVVNPDMANAASETRREQPAVLDRARALVARNAWVGAYEAFSAAQRVASLDAADFERFATAAYLSGHDRESTEVWARAHQSFLGTGDVERAVRCAFWLAFGLLDKGEHARGGGWLARGRRLLETGSHDCVEQGYLLIPLNSAPRCTPIWQSPRRQPTISSGRNARSSSTRYALSWRKDGMHSGRTISVERVPRASRPRSHDSSRILRYRQCPLKSCVASQRRPC